MADLWHFKIFLFEHEASRSCAMHKVNVQLLGRLARSAGVLLFSSLFLLGRPRRSRSASYCSCHNSSYQDARDEVARRPIVLVFIIINYSYYSLPSAFLRDGKRQRHGSNAIRRGLCSHRPERLQFSKIRNRSKTVT